MKANPRRKKLALQTETLVRLSDADLGGVAAGISAASNCNPWTGGGAECGTETIYSTVN
jgi:hypothetical protein